MCAQRKLRSAWAFWVVAERTATLLVLSCRGSNGVVMETCTQSMHYYKIMAYYYAYEPRHDKTNKTSVRPANTQISLGIRPVWSVFAVRMKKAWVLSYPLSTQRWLWLDWADAQADLSLRWAHTRFVGFDMSWLISPIKVVYWTLKEYTLCYKTTKEFKVSFDNEAEKRVWTKFTYSDLTDVTSWWWLFNVTVYLICN